MSFPSSLQRNVDSKSQTCTHCDENVVIALYNFDDNEQKKPFCCQGCLTVFNIINQKGLTDYYEIKNNSALFKRRAPVELKVEKFNYLDSADFITEYTYKNSEKLQTMEFYLEGIHCLACLWLIEKLPEFLADVKNARLDMNKSVVTISIFSNGKFSNVAKELSNLGYRPHPLKRNEEIEKFKREEDRSNMLKIGIAGAASGNIMIYAVSIYGGADGVYLKIFSYMTVILAFPVMLYSALPFYQSAWNAIKNKSINIDVPVAIALIIGFFHGVIHLLMGSGENYFDTLTDLVFLLLLSRYLLAKIQEKGLSATDLNFFYQANSVKKKENDQYIDIHPKYLKINDIVKIDPQEIFPVDGIVLEGKSNLNNSLLTGESLPVSVSTNDAVYSGTQNIDSELIIQVTKTDRETRLGHILKEVESGWIQKAKIVELTNRFSKHFILSIFALALGVATILIYQGHYKLALERSLALLIVTCPCALALATPLTLTHTLSRASKKGIIIKNDEVIEKLSAIKEVYLDKTGTVTFGNLKIEQFEYYNNSKHSMSDIIATLEQKSNHPVAKALKEYIKNNFQYKTLDVCDWKEIIGLGVQGKIENIFYEIKNSQIYADNALIAKFTLKDQIRPDSKNAIQVLNKLGIESFLVSGDIDPIAKEVGTKIGISPKQIFSQISPEKKLEIIEKSNHSLMVGDGANDAMALSKAYVGIAVHGSMDISLRAADVYLTTPGISPIVDLIIISKETMKVIYRNLTISVIYNILSIIGVYMGIVSPLMAAIIMPLSSVSVLVSTVIGTKALNKRLKV
jgi:Cu2+-exporting ATPase/Cu+-exporting ATPase